MKTETTHEPTAYTDTHLDVAKALDCAIALMYFIPAYAQLTNAEKVELLNAYSADQWYSLGAIIYAMEDEAIFTLSLFAVNGTPDQVVTLLNDLTDAFVAHDDNKYFVGTLLPTEGKLVRSLTARG